MSDFDQAMLTLAILSWAASCFFAYMWKREQDRGADNIRRIETLRLQLRIAIRANISRPLGDALLSVRRVSDEQALVNALRHHDDFVGRDD